MKDCCGETPKPARGTRALPRSTLSICAARARNLQMPKAKTAATTASIYAVVGSDEAEVKRVAAELATKLTPPEAGDFGQEVIDGAVDNAEQAAARIGSTIEALQTVAFWGGVTWGWMKKADLIGDNGI